MLDSLPSTTPSLQSSSSDAEAQAAREGRELHAAGAGSKATDLAP